MHTVHGVIQTPVFMNVGTVGAIKGAVSTDDLKEIKCQGELSNTYHLHVRTGDKIIKELGGLHKFMNRDRPILTDNHICAAGSITKAVQMAREYVSFVTQIEVECETLEQVTEAAACGAAVIMLDNMDNETMRKAVKIIDGRAKTECSGNVTAERLLEIADIGVDFVSSGALTYASPAMDISLKNLTAL